MQLEEIKTKESEWLLFRLCELENRIGSYDGNERGLLSSRVELDLDKLNEEASAIFDELLERLK